MHKIHWGTLYDLAVKLVSEAVRLVIRVIFALDLVPVVQYHLSGSRSKLVLVTVSRLISPLMKATTHDFRGDKLSEIGKHPINPM